MGKFIKVAAVLVVVAILAYKSLEYYGIAPQGYLSWNTMGVIAFAIFLVLVAGKAIGIFLFMASVVAGCEGFTTGNPNMYIFAGVLALVGMVFYRLGFGDDDSGGSVSTNSTNGGSGSDDRDLYRYQKEREENVNRRYRGKDSWYT
jgi:hypothetical protein